MQVLFQWNDLNHMIIVTSSFWKTYLFKIKCFPSTLKRKAGVFKFLWFEERFREVPFSEDSFSRLEWTVGIFVEIKPRFVSGVVFFKKLFKYRCI